MGADYAKYCTCLNKENQTQEASLTRKENTPNYLNQANDATSTDLHPQLMMNCKITNDIAKAKATSNRHNSMSSDSTDRIDRYSTLILNQKIDYPNGDQYIGKVRNNKREGKGKLTFKSNGYYEGEFHDDLFEGYGTLITETTVYYGNFAFGERNGNGKSENKNEATEYVGQWEHNVKNGFGKETYSDGSFYEGNYINGKKEGKGRLNLANGLKYSGEFSNDNIEGQGTFIWNDNKKYSGEWKENNLCGFGVLTQEKDLHIGYFDNDQKNALGLNYFHKSKSFLLGNWVDDSVKGLAVFVNPNQEMQFWEMNDNKLVHYYKSEEEKEKIINSKEYKELKDFFSYLRTNDVIVDLQINDSFSL